MRTITITKDLYKFEELPADVQDKVIEKNWDWNVECYDWWEYTIEDFKEKLEEAGVSKPDIEFSGFSSQGDGASFTCKYVDLAKLIKFTHADEKFPLIAKAIDEGKIDYSCHIGRVDRHYVHSRTAELVATDFQYIDDELEDENPDAYHTKSIVLETQFDDLIDFLEQWREEYSGDIYRTLENEYDYLTSREAVIETIDANEIEFTIEGEIA